MKKNETLALLGLARKAGRLVIGAEESRRAIREGIARVVVLADDASSGHRGKVEAVARARGVPVVGIGSRGELGQALGKGLVTAVAVTDKGLSSKLLDLVQGPGREESAGPRTKEQLQSTQSVRRSRAECG